MSYERLNLKTGQVITEEVFAHLEDGIEGAANAVLMTPILYADLVALRDAGKLKAGMFYRITDFVTTTVQENTQSAGHAFDVIVMAVDSKTLSEEARAIVHEGDTYFTEAGANLAAWKVWYALDNDSARFAWADAENGKGVIYRLIDEWNNDCPYDFKNIIYSIPMKASWQINKYGSWHGAKAERSEADDVQVGDISYCAWKGTITSGPSGTALAYSADANISDGKLYDISEGEVTESVNMKVNITAESANQYTFSGIEPLTDGSLLDCVNNCILPLTQKRADFYNFSLNFILLGANSISNYFDENCQTIHMGSNCSFNKFMPSCSYIYFGKGSGMYYSNNTFGNNCSSVTLQNDATASSSQQIQNYRIANGMTGTVEVTRGLAYETTIAKATDGTIKQFNLADLAN